jgi:DNA-binding NarL/FixJ family response regulator
MIAKTERPRVILIVAPPGDIQAGLQLLAARVPSSEVLAVADALAALAAIARHRPSLVIVDGDILRLADPGLVPRIKARWPSILCLVLSNCPEERQAALAGGADAALVKGFPAARLVTAVNQLLATGQVEAT